MITMKTITTKGWAIVDLQNSVVSDVFTDKDAADMRIKRVQKDLEHDVQMRLELLECTISVEMPK